MNELLSLTRHLYIGEIELSICTCGSESIDCVLMLSHQRAFSVNTDLSGKIFYLQRVAQTPYAQLVNG